MSTSTKAMRNQLYLALILLVVLSPCCFPFCSAGEAEFAALVKKMEIDVLEFARAIESYHALRCDSKTLEACSETNYHETMSALPGQQCYTEGDLAIDVCAESSCGALWDYTTSSVRIPNGLVEDTTDYYPKDPRAVEVICYSSFMDSYLQSKKHSDQVFWDRYGLRSPQAYFGSSTGAFRIYPGRTSNETGVYDPRNRPWFIAASSGPKNVILILDTSGSMDDFNRIGKLKIAAKQIISSLTVADRIAMVEYSSEGRKIGRDSGKYVYVATKQNKDILLQEIEQLQALGSTNTYDAFVKAFEILDDSYQQELTLGCTTAILFLTDGRTTEPANFTNTTEREKYVTDLVVPELERFRGRYQHDFQLFTYSIGEREVEAFPKALACATGGVWSRLDDTDDIFEALTSYYQLFTLGLGMGPNENFTAWVEPYRFATGGILGTTVSAPLYDRTRNPPHFLGVVGMDFPLEALDKTLGVPSGGATLLDLMVKSSWAPCPTWNLTLCELESFRRRGAVGDEALCTQSCGMDDYVDIEVKQCATIDDVPQSLWADTSFRGIDYEKRVCCRHGEATPADTCIASDNASSSEGLSLGIIVGVTVGFVVVLVLIAGIAWKVMNTTERQRVSLRDVNVIRSPHVDVNVIRSPQVVPLPPPLAPPERSLF